MQDLPSLLQGVAVAAGAFLIFRALLSVGVPRVSGAQAKQLVDQGALLVDVRTPGEYAAGKIRGSKNIPLQDLDRRLKEFGDKGRPVVLCCASGARSAAAGRRLKKAGYQVHNLGPWTRWPK